jgi:hypothetical protein
MKRRDAVVVRFVPDVGSMSVRGLLHIRGGGERCFIRSLPTLATAHPSMRLALLERLLREIQ